MVAKETISEWRHVEELAAVHDIQLNAFETFSQQQRSLQGGQNSVSVWFFRCGCAMLCHKIIVGPFLLEPGALLRSTPGFSCKVLNYTCCVYVALCVGWLGCFRSVEFGMSDSLVFIVFFPVHFNIPDRLVEWSQSRSWTHYLQTSAAGYKLVHHVHSVASLVILHQSCCARRLQEIHRMTLHVSICGCQRSRFMTQQPSYNLKHKHCWVNSWRTAAGLSGRMLHSSRRW